MPEASWAAANAALDTHGGYGFVDVYDIERKFRESRLYRAAPLNKVMDDADLAELARREVFGRGAEVWEVANVIAFLASGYATFMTGEVFAALRAHTILGRTMRPAAAPDLGALQAELAALSARPG